MEGLPAFELVGAMIVLGTVAAIRQAFDPFVSRFGALLAIGVGIVLGVGYAAEVGLSVFVGAVHGVVAGLVASGLWSGTKNATGR